MIEHLLAVEPRFHRRCSACFAIPCLRARSFSAWSGSADNIRSLSHDPSKGALPFKERFVPSSVEEALLSRRSIRAFHPTLVPHETVERILALASRAPSGTNVQPWKVHVLSGKPKDRLSAEMHAAFMAHGEEGWKRPYEYYPVKWKEPYLGRRRKLGWDLYGLLGIRKGEFEKTKQQHARNYL